jgi:hypothetical protein
VVRLQTRLAPTWSGSANRTTRTYSREPGCRRLARFLSCFLLFALVHLAGAEQRLVGWMTFFGATILMTVSLIEVTFYISALNPDPAMMPSISLKLISAVQHLYFIVAAPALFFPLSIVLVSSPILPRLFGYLALILATAFAALGVIFLLRLTLPDAVTAFGGVQALWWLAAAITLIVRSGRIASCMEEKESAVS